MTPETPAGSMPKWPKRCGCGRSYTQDQWEKLPLLGLQPPREGAGERAGHLWYGQELRNCACGSTLAIEVEPCQPVHGSLVTPR